MSAKLITSLVMKDSVAIVGGGVAGLVAAKRLSGLGIRTRVYDQKKVLGNPVKASGILSINGLESLGMDYRRAVTNTLYGARFHAAGNMTKVLAKTPKAHVLNRKLLNEICHDEAVGAGAEVVLEKRINGTELDDLGRANIIVGADGAVSTVAKHFSLGQISSYVLTYKAEFNTDVLESGVVDLFFDKGLSPGLFGWLCPNEKDILEVGIGIRPGRETCKAAFERFIAQKEISEAVNNGKMISGEASIIPMALRKKFVDGKKEVLLVGDAAGQVKPSTGGGVVYGGNAAIIASEVVRNHIQKGMALETYERLYRKLYSMDTTIHYLANMLYSSLGPSSMGFLISVLDSLHINDFLGKYGDMDMPSLTMKNVFSSG